jgi:hypothetical protein
LACDRASDRNEPVFEQNRFQLKRESTRIQKNLIDLAGEFPLSAIGNRQPATGKLPLAV